MTHFPWHFDRPLEVKLRVRCRQCQMEAYRVITVNSIKEVIKVMKGER